MAKTTKEQRLVRKMTKSIAPKTSGHLAPGFTLPNHSGDHSSGAVNKGPQLDKDIANKKYVDDELTALTTTDHSSADTAYVPAVLYNTDATPPTASNFPIGTIYIQYTA